MQKIIAISTIMLILTTGCNKDSKTLECTQYDEKTIVTIEKGKITKIATNDEKESVSNAEWKTLQNFYEFTGNETSEEIANHLKELNESIGYTCTLK